MNVEFSCPHCNQLNNIYVEVESCSDYYFDNTCEFCNESMESDKLDLLIFDEVGEHNVSEAEYLRDTIGDR